MDSRRGLVFALVVATAIPFAAFPAGSALPESTGVTTRASLRDGGDQAVQLAPVAAGSPSISADNGGQSVAFVSEASNLVAGDTNGFADVFVRDRTGGTTVLVSVGVDGAPADGPSRAPSISADGNVVAFESDAANLVPDDTNAETDVFLRNLQDGTTTRVSVGVGGAQADGPSGEPDLSDDGATVAFTSDAPNLVADDANDALDVFVWRAGAGTSLVSRAQSGNVPAAGDSFQPAISGDGTVVAFVSDADNILPPELDTNGKLDVFVRILETDVVERVSVSGTGGQAGDASFEPSLSEDGNVVAFSSDATDLVMPPSGNVLAVFVHDRDAGTTELVSVASGGNQANQDSYHPAISGDGTVVAFASDATNLVDPDTNGVTDVFVRSLDAETVRASQEENESPLTLPSVEPSITTTGVHVAFATGAIDPGTGSPGPGTQIRVREGAASTRVDISPDGEPAGPPQSIYPSMSEDGRYVAFVSSAPDLVDGDTNRWTDVFVHDRQTARTTRVNVGPEGAEADGPSLSFPFLSADGRLVVFDSMATNLVPGDVNGASDIFVHDRETGTTTRVSVGDAGEANGGSFLPFISGNGRFVTFESLATNLVPGDTNSTRDVFVRDLETGTTERVSVGPDGAEVGGESFAPSISGDGRYVAFASEASTLVANDTNTATDVFVHDRDADTTVRLSVGPDGAEADDDTAFPIISGDGRNVVFSSFATNLVADDSNGERDVFVADREAGTVERVSVGPDGTVGNGPSDSPWISQDGRFVAFASGATNLVPADTNGKVDAFVRDRLLGTTTRVSVALTGESDGDVRFPTMSGDGRFVTFSSPATNLVPDDTNQAVDVFVHDTTPIRGYRLVATDGGIFAFGAAEFFGSTGDLTLNQPIVGMASTPSGKGYWLVASDGGIFSFGDAEFYGSTGDITLNQPIVGMASTPSGKGYWLVATDGGIFSFGDADFFGSTGDIKLNLPVVGMASTPTGQGYLLVASDGGIFAFGDAEFFGSTGDITLNEPIVGMSATRSGRGYWLVATDGGIFAFGDATFHGSTGDLTLNQPIGGMGASPSGGGYWLVASDGGIFSFGDADFAGSTGDITLNQPIVGMAAR